MPRRPESTHSGRVNYLCNSRVKFECNSTDNKSGMDLNEAIRSDGYDGIVTIDENGNLSETVDLTVGKSNSMLRAMNRGGIIERKEDNRTYI